MRLSATASGSHWRLFATGLVAVLMPLVFLSCAPDAKYQACAVDDECKADFGETAYCMRSHCVECVSHASCRDGERCIAGMCERPDERSSSNGNARSIRLE